MMPLDTDGYPFVRKDPDAILPYRVDFAGLENAQDGAKSNWLDIANGHTIAAFTVAIAGPDEVLANIEASTGLVDGGTAVMVWLTGGTPAADPQDVQRAEVYRVTVHVRDSGNPPQEDDRSFNVHVVER